MKVIKTLRDSCPNGIDCDRIHDTDGDDLVVRGRKITDPAVLQSLGLAENESAVLITRTLLPDV